MSCSKASTSYQQSNGVGFEIPSIWKTNSKIAPAVQSVWAILSSSPSFRWHLVVGLPTGGGIVANESKRWTDSTLTFSDQYLAITSCFCFHTYSHNIIFQSIIKTVNSHRETSGDASVNKSLDLFHHTVIYSSQVLSLNFFNCFFVWCRIGFCEGFNGLCMFSRFKTITSLKQPAEYKKELNLMSKCWQ